jgi:hypothetical protein
MQVVSFKKTKGPQAKLQNEAWLKSEIAAVHPEFAENCHVSDMTREDTGRRIKKHVREWFGSRSITIKAIKVAAVVDVETPRIAVCEVYFPGAKMTGLVALAESRHLKGDFSLEGKKALSMHERFASTIGFPIGTGLSSEVSLVSVQDSEREYSKRIRSWRVKGALLLAGLGVGAPAVEGMRSWHQAALHAKRLKSDLDACEAAAEGFDRRIAEGIQLEAARIDFCVSSADDLDARREVQREQREAVVNGLRPLLRLACLLEEPSLTQDEFKRYLVNIKGEDLVLLEAELVKAIKESNVEETRKLFQVRTTLMVALLRDNDHCWDLSQGTSGRFNFAAWQTGDELLLAGSDPLIHSIYGQALGAVLSKRLLCTVMPLKEGNSDLNTEQKKLQKQNWIKAAPSIANLHKVLKLAEDVSEQPQRSGALLAALTAADYAALESRLESATRSNDLEETRFLLQMYLRLLREQLQMQNGKVGYVPLMHTLDKTCCERIKESTNPLMQGLYGQVLYQLRSRRLDPKAIKRLQLHTDQPSNSQ